jgi:predicted nucleotidyltransferase
MQLEHPFRVVTPTLDGDVLYVLARAEAAFTPPQVHHLVGLRSEDGIRRALARLTTQGIVTGVRVGRAVEYRLNRAHLAANAVIEIAKLRESLITHLRECIDAWSVPTPYAAIFGSAAHGTMSPASDIDVFVVRARSVEEDDTTWSEQIHDLAQRVREWTGNIAEVLEYEERDLSRTPHDFVVDEVARDGIPLTGQGDYLRRKLRDA